MSETKNKLNKIVPFILLLWVVIGCGGLPEINNPLVQSPSKSVKDSVKDKDYIMLKRVRILDEMGFDRPVEAMSILVPDGWRVEGGIRWKGVNECRGDIVTFQISATSPDGKIQFTAYPSRTFVNSSDQMMRQTLLATARQGGCQVSEPFSAKQFLENFSRNTLKANVANIRTDESQQHLLDQLMKKSNQGNQQYGLNMNSSGEAVYGALSWNDGTKGLVQAGVFTMTSQRQDMMSGAAFSFSSTNVTSQSVIRYPADREAEALKIFGTIISSSRANPVWTQAKDAFLTKLGNAEHAGRMERIRLAGEQSSAYAKSRSEAADAQMRSWERRQASSDASHRRYIQTIREVETWKDNSGNPVELNAGYKYGWSKPDGTYILTNSSLFDPAVEFQQDWEKMQKSPQ